MKAMRRREPARVGDHQEPRSARLLLKLGPSSRDALKAEAERRGGVPVSRLIRHAIENDLERSLESRSEAAA